MKLKRSDRIALGCAAFGLVVTAVFYWYWPYATFWGYLIVWVVAVGVSYEAVTKAKARETIIDRRERD